jgi:hypothetical protein
VIVKDLWALLIGWNNTEAHERSLQIEIAALRANLDEMTLFSGPLVETPATALQPPVRAAEPASAPVPVAISDNSRGADDTAADRMLILHYHLFKNAGTSIDAMLKHNFGKTWAEHEFMAWLGEVDDAGRSTAEAFEEALYRQRQPLFLPCRSHSSIPPPCGSKAPVARAWASAATPRIIAVTSGRSCSASCSTTRTDPSRHSCCQATQRT